MGRCVAGDALVIGFAERGDSARRASRCAVLLHLALVVSLAAASGLPVTAQATVAPEWFGTWHLDVSRSTFGSVASRYVRGTWRITHASDGQVGMVYDLVGARGGVTHMEWTGRFDGHDYRLQGPDAVVTYAYTLLDPRTLNLVVKVDGRVANTAHVVLSPADTVTATTQAGSAHGPVTLVSVYTKR
jgi:hypothetical protein